ncbi:high affinity K+ transporter 5 [Actinidia rufa]|uniref:Potassium transporter n=1 Tax=Actinidia rufa TaxID=165716 RepID=A0A7J0ENK0_9ERIC|nr:high affinity K+ transporter 5 [Actinidia rufa]
MAESGTTTGTSFQQALEAENGGALALSMKEEEEEEEEEEANNNLMKERKVSWAKLGRVDSLNLEAGRLTFSQSHTSINVNWRVTLSLAFQSLGVIYGDIGTSPLYVFASTFPDGIGNTDDLLGVLSLIIYTLILVPMIKYIFIVLLANDNGDGGTFALYSLICRYAKVSLIPNHQPEDTHLSNYNLDIPSNQLGRAQKIQHKLENSKTAQVLLFLVTILGTSMVIGDGVLTPCISVLSAVSGIKALNQDAVVGVSVAILIILFSIQRFGTDNVGYSFAPIIVLWFSFISGIGLYNLFKHDAGVLRAFNPIYIIDYFKRNGKKGWMSLGGVVLCITGTEAMFADLGHFSVRAVQISFSGVVFPALLAAYCGQAAYLVKFPNHVEHTFYDSVPDKLYWPTFVVAVAAAIIASQAMISGAFAIISQSRSLDCFPRVKVIHTSAQYEGQVYIPEVNYILMVACVIVTIGFKTTEKNWKCIWHCCGSCNGDHDWYGYSNHAYYMEDKHMGGYLPLTLSAVLMIIMGTWHYVHKQRYMFELGNKVSSDFVRDLSLNPDISRVPGIGLLYSELVQGIPPIFRHFIENIPSVHSVLVFVSLKSIPISKVAMEERFLFRQVEPRDYRMFRCVVRYGYNDVIEEPKEFERLLVENLKEFIRHDHFIREGSVFLREQMEDQPAVNLVPHSAPLMKDGKRNNGSSRVSSASIQSLNNIVAAKSGNFSSRMVSGPIQGAEKEMQFVQKAMDNGVVYLLGETEVRAQQNSSLLKKIVVNYVYNFLRKNSRQGEKVMAIPRSRLLRVGMTYEI